MSMTWLHTWIGLLPGWLLYAIFITGTAAYFRPEITRWMQPEMPPREASSAAALRLALDTLAKAAPEADNWYIDLPGERKPGLGLGWYTRGVKDGYQQRTLDPAGAVQVRDTKGGEFFYRFHFQLQLPHPWGRWIACFAAVFLMTALVTGIIAHRRFFGDFFTFRPGKASARSWLDFHTLAGVLALPFYLMISYTALVMLLAMFSPWGRMAAEPAAPPAAEGTSQPVMPQKARPVPEVQPLAPLLPMLAEAERRWGKGEVERVNIFNRKDTGMAVKILATHGRTVSYNHRAALAFHGMRGTLENAGAERGAVTRLHDFLYGLHLARFADPLLRWLFFFMGLLGSAMTATGLLMWTVKRRPKDGATREGGLGHHLVSGLNVAVIAGFPVSIGVFFWANRLIPAAFPGRSDLEINLLFSAWALAFLHAFLRPAISAWKEQLAAAAALFLLLPALDAVTAGSYLLQALRILDGAHLGFDATVFALGIFFGSACRRVGRRRPAGTGRVSSQGDPLPAMPAAALAASPGKAVVS